MVCPGSTCSSLHVRTETNRLAGGFKIALLTESQPLAQARMSDRGQRTRFLGGGISLLISTALLAAEDLPLTHFTATAYDDWTATGTAFQAGPAPEAEWQSLEITHPATPFVISSERAGDRPQGTLTSPPFHLARRYLAFRIAGGNYERHTCLNLLVKGQTVRSATGWQSDRLAATSWDVSRWEGQMAQLQVVDTDSGDWGHVNVDGLVLTDSPERLPVVTTPLYQETLRPQFHFTARQWTLERLNPGQYQEGWCNDLNGLIYYEGEYHLFAQRWAACWLHAVSPDLLHWTELAPAFWEETRGSGVQSGTCVIDYANTSGLATDRAHPAMVAFCTRFDNRSHLIHFSLDKGRTWQPYAQNPFMLYAERDPKVFWHQPTQRWVMLLYGQEQYHILTSPNLLTWHDEHHPIPDSFECPDLFSLPLGGDAAQPHWVLIQGNGNYTIGQFDGTAFHAESPRHACDVGPHFYATQSWHNTDTGDGRRIQTAWMRGGEFPNMPFNQMISFPCQLTLQGTPDGLRVFRQPIAELATLHRSSEHWSAVTIPSGGTLPLAPNGQLYHLEAEVNLTDDARLIFDLRGMTVVLTRHTLASGHAPATVPGEVQHIEILLDRTSIETFINAGEISSTRFILPSKEGLSLRVEGGSVRIQSLSLHTLNSAWPQDQ